MLVVIILNSLLISQIVLVFWIRILPFRISDDPRFASKVSGVLVEPSTDLRNKLNGRNHSFARLLFSNKARVILLYRAVSDSFFLSCLGFSPDQKFPQGQFAPYHNTGYEWNPIVRYELPFFSSSLSAYL